MQIKLINGYTYTVTRAEVTNGRFEIDFKDKSCEEIQEIFSDPANLTNIELLTMDGEKFGQVPGYTKYSGVMLLGDTKTVILAQGTDEVLERITNAEARALQAAALAENAKQLTEDIVSQITDLQMAMCDLYEGMV